MKYEAITIGTSSGGMNALKFVFSKLTAVFPIPIIVVQHIGARSDSQWIEILDKLNQLNIKEANEKEAIESGNIYIAPPNYHLLIEKDRTFSLTIDERVNFARPSIDVLFESAAEAYRDKLIGLILTGSNSDGTKGMKKIQELGGLTIVQDPSTAESSFMPESVIEEITVDHILPLEKIGEFLNKLN